MNPDGHNQWTGGQYSVFRACLGLYCLLHFAYLLPWAAEVFSSSGMLPQASLSPLARLFPNILGWIDHPAVVTALCLSGVGASLLLLVGQHDRLAALWVWYVLACFFGRNPLIQNPSLPYLGWMLLMHAALPKAPYGSLEARGRADPGNGWILPQSLFAAAWIVLAVSYSYSGVTKLFSPSWMSGETVAAVLHNPLARDGLISHLFLALPESLLRLITWFILLIEVLFAPLALWKPARPWLWGGMLLVQIGFALLLRFPDLTFAMLLFHLLTFDPGWFKRKALDRVIVFYDGTCVLCHGFVRFLLAEDNEARLRFAPLDSAISARLLPERQNWPVSMVVRTPDGAILLEDAAVSYLLIQLGGLWRVLARFGQVMPRPVRRWCYHAIGQRRLALFGATLTACPRLPAKMRHRVLA
jgi:predicted DCC family thiol-disulfide oxidoreductase YuxK